ncbi:uncharacterized protein EV420DRAFT_1673366 [Desarmillaria tabescens]|uniref:Uncharacterized protein n=1 Tax=Armillaria tabescens TaxID=1929756 RepID=A0AA39KFG5_ARMTA|nr:uncharacterized protein EV420DRAFT_1673366 [Desarmillaria tabescens]KAK0460207.1 hypothetical protein EV420DRAFT_1673366 [Desarmillaria tabescens]
MDEKTQSSQIITSSYTAFTPTFTFIPSSTSTNSRGIEIPNTLAATADSEATAYSHKMSPTVIVTIIIGSLTLPARNNTDEIGLETVVSNPILPLISQSSPPSARTMRESTMTIESLTSESSSLQRRLSQSSRNANEEEMVQLRQQLGHTDEQMGFVHGGSLPPSYHSARRSDNSDPFRSSLPLATPLPPYEIG